MEETLLEQRFRDKLLGSVIGIVVIGCSCVSPSGMGIVFTAQNAGPKERKGQPHPLTKRGGI
jgi:hypothetical protein